MQADAVVILAIDTTTRGGSVAVTRDDELLSLVPGDETRTHGERTPAEIARALQEAQIAKSTIDLVAVAAGPGAFTGLRIGLAAAQGIALTLDRPAVGVSALDALAWVAPSGSDQPHVIAAWMDAQRGDVFAALYKVPGTPQGVPPQIVAPVTGRPADVLAAWSERFSEDHIVFIGDAAERDADLIGRIGHGRWVVRSPEPLAPAIARIGRRLALEGHAGKPHHLTPIYVRRPDAELERERRHSS